MRPVASSIFGSAPDQHRQVSATDLDGYVDKAALQDRLVSGGIGYDDIHRRGNVRGGNTFDLCIVEVTGFIARQVTQQSRGSTLKVLAVDAHRISPGSESLLRIYRVYFRLTAWGTSRSWRC